MLTFRPASKDDCELMFNWANDPEVRRYSFHPEPIPRADHVRWFGCKLKDPDSKIYILSGPEKEPAGQIRFHKILPDEAEIAVMIKKEFRGRGFGAKGIRLLSDHILSEKWVKLIHALIKEDNQGSIKSFKKAGYRRERITERNGYRCFEFIYPPERK